MEEKIEILNPEANFMNCVNAALKELDLARKSIKAFEKIDGKIFDNENFLIAKLIINDLETSAIYLKNKLRNYEPAQNAKVRLVKGLVAGNNSVPAVGGGATDAANC